MPTALTQSVPIDSAVVLSEAATNAAGILGIKIRPLAKILGISETKAKQVRKGLPLTPQSHAGQAAMLLVRIYRSIYTLNGGDTENMKHWIKTSNLHLNGVPMELMETTEGLVKTCWYLDAMRGQA